MIENEKQFNTSKSKLNELKTEIGKIENDATQDPQRKKLILASLNNFASEIENDIVIYEMVTNKK